MFETLSVSRHVSLDATDMRSLAQVFVGRRIFELWSFLNVLLATVKKSKSKHFVQRLWVYFNGRRVRGRSLHNGPVKSFCLFLTSFFCIALMRLLSC